VLGRLVRLWFNGGCALHRCVDYGGCRSETVGVAVGAHCTLVGTSQSHVLLQLQRALPDRNVVNGVLEQDREGTIDPEHNKPRKQPCDVGHDAA